jgi:8-amino-7-oxononanoate synthase
MAAAYSNAPMRMTDLDQELGKRLKEVRAAGLYRELRRVDSCKTTHIEIDGKTLLNFASNDYLGLANHPELIEAACEAAEEYGAGSKASPLISGFLRPHKELDEALADFKGTEAALSFSTGYAAAIGTICAVAGKDDIVILDKLVHASLVDGARLSGAKLRVFHHNDLDDLEDILKWAGKSRSASGRVLIVTESVFSMDGDHAPLKEIVELKEKHGAWLMVDEAHGTGLYGAKGCGLAEECGVSRRIEIQMGTLGKAIGASGGFIAGSRTLIDYLVNRARSYIFSTSPVPAAPAAAAAGIGLVRSSVGDERRTQLWQNWQKLQSGLNGLSAHPPASQRSAIIPIIIGDETKAVETARALRKMGIFIPAVRYPTVARGKARLRLTITASHTNKDLTSLFERVRTSKIGIQAELLCIT